ncbi:hypothetical protein EBB07_28940 [Paenibacillaceae bacterium]|nr:hypothetical protein EBB07_28940 [Paenibacillaceae bacterium]
MDIKKIAGMASIAGVIVEQNISEIEKYQTRIKVSRFMGTNLFFSFSLAFIFSYVYWVYFYTIGHYILHLMFPSILFFISIIFTQKSASKLISNLTMLFALISLQIFLSYFLLDAILILIKTVSGEPIAMSIFTLSMISIFMYSIFYTCKNLSEIVLQKYMRKNFKVRFALTTGQTIYGSLITITKKGDYIMKIDSKNTEILIKDTVVSSIELINTEE